MARARSPRRRTTMVVVALGVIFGGLVGATMAWALFSASATNTYTITADTLPQGATPNTPTIDPNGTTVTVTFSQVSTITGNVAITDYTLNRYPAGGGPAVLVSASCSISSGTVTCTESNVPNGAWQYTDTPIYDNWVGIESNPSGTVTVNSTPTASAPTVSANVVANGTNPVWTDGQDVSLSDSPTDVGGPGVASVTYYYCPTSTGTCTSSTPWTFIGSSSTSPNWSVPWSSWPADGTYNVVAVATDTLSNGSLPSVATEVGIDTTPPMVSTPIVNGVS